MGLCIDLGSMFPNHQGLHQDLQMGNNKLYFQCHPASSALLPVTLPSSDEEKGNPCTEFALQWFRQTEWMSNHNYQEKLMELIKVYEYLSREPSTLKASIDALLAEPDTSTPIEREGAWVRARDEYLGVLLLTRSNPKSYSTLIMDVENQFTRGNTGYPHMLTSAYNLLVNFRNPHSTPHLQNQDSRLAFT